MRVDDLGHGLLPTLLNLLVSKSESLVRYFVKGAWYSLHNHLAIMHRKSGRVRSEELF